MVLLTGPLLHARLGLVDQLLHGVVNDHLAGAAEPLVTDHAFVVDEVNRRGAGQVPLLGDGTPPLARGRVAERPPGKVMLLHDLLEGCGVRFTDVDADPGAAGPGTPGPGACPSG